MNQKKMFPYMSNTKQNLNSLIDELVVLGEDRESLSLWNDIFDILEESEQIELITNLEKEREQLAHLITK